MDGILLGIGILLGFFVCYFLFHEKDIIKNIILAFFMYFCCYVIISGLLFGLDIFSIESALVIIAIMEGILLLILFFCIGGKNKVELECPVREYLFPIIILLFLLPFVWNKFGFFGMGQDEGVYQTQAIAFMNNSYKIQKDIPEYQSMTRSEQDTFREYVEYTLRGYNLFDSSLPYQFNQKKMSDISGYYHGIPTFAAILALWGKIFGLSHMADIQTIFYVCGLFLLFFTCEHLHLRKPVKYIAGIIYGYSPILVWVSKSSLTEIFLTCVIIGCLYFMTGEGNKTETACAVLTVIAFSFYHLTIYTILPIFILIFWGLYLYSKNKRYIYASIAVLAAFVISMVCAFKITASYTYLNYKPVIKMLGLSNELLFPVLVGCSVLGMVLSAVLLLSERKITVIFPYNKNIYNIAVRFSIVSFVVIQMFIIHNFMSDGNISFLKGFQNSSVFGYIIYGGGMLWFAALLYIFYKPSICWMNRQSMIVTGMFGYCIIFYTCFLRKEIPYHYYYARYLAPFICVEILVIAIVVNEWNKRSAKVIAYIMAAAYIITCFPYNLVLAQNHDDTRMSWDIMEDIADIIPEDATIYMDYNLCQLLYLPVREMTNCFVFPIKNDKHQEKIDIVNDDDKNIYYITNMYRHFPKYELVYMNSFETSQDNNVYHGELLPLPYGMEKETGNVVVYKASCERYQYRIADNNIVMDGYYPLEQVFCWSHPQQNIMKCVLRQDDYMVKVVQGTGIPLDALGREALKVELCVNGKIVDSYMITNENFMSDLVFELPKEMVEEGINDVSFISEPWSPSEYGIGDGRTLGVAVAEILFLPQ